MYLLVQGCLDWIDSFQVVIPPRSCNLLNPLKWADKQILYEMGRFGDGNSAMQNEDLAIAVSPMVSFSDRTIR